MMESETIFDNEHGQSQFNPSAKEAVQNFYINIDAKPGSNIFISPAKSNIHVEYHHHYWFHIIHYFHHLFHKHPVGADNSAPHQTKE